MNWVLKPKRHQPNFNDCKKLKDFLKLQIMKELSYNRALELGIEPIHYRCEILAEIGIGDHLGTIDALV